MWALALLIELGPHKDRGKLWPGWELYPQPLGLITAAPPTELQGQTGASRGRWRCQLHGNEYVQVQGRVMFIANIGRVALIFRTNWMIEMVVGSIPTLVRVFLCPCVGPILSVGLTLTWSVGRKLALYITLYHSICPKYKCYMANVCNKRNPSLYLIIHNSHTERKTGPNRAATSQFRPVLGLPLWGLYKISTWLL